MTARINARLGPDLARKLGELRRRTGAGTTEIVRTALERYYAESPSPASARELLVDFVGCADGPSNLASEYKAVLRRSLARKTQG